MTSYDPIHYATGVKAIASIIDRLRNAPLQQTGILNVNVPDVAWSEIRGFCITRLGNRHKSEGVIRQTDPRGQPMYWVGPPGAAQDAGEGTDFHAVENKYISITPLQIDLTRYDSLQYLDDWLHGHS
jgi:5'-nucleotidase